MDAERKAALAEFHRAKIVEAAGKLFYEKGEDGATIDDIAREAGYSKATIYVYFKNKEEIIGAAALRGMRLLREKLEAAINAYPGWETGYYSVWTAAAEFYRENPAAFEATLRPIRVDLDAPGTPPVYREIYETGEEINRTLEEFLARGKREGVLRGDLPATQTVLLFWAALSGVIRLAAQKREYLGQRLKTTEQGFLRFGAELLLESIRRRERR